MALLVTEIDFVGNPDGTGYEQHLAEALQEAAKKLSLRNIQENRVAKVQVTEIKDLISL
jgi:hypothetical protein